VQSSYKKVGLFFIVIELFFLVTACTDDNQPVGRMPSVLTMDETAPDFVFQSLMDSQQIKQKLSMHVGKVIYLDFWASWCKPCLKSMPELNLIRADLKDNGFEVIAVNLDLDPENGKKFIVNYPVDYPVVRASNENIHSLYQISGLPTAYIIDRQGILRYAHQGFNEKDIKLIKKQVFSLLK